MNDFIFFLFFTLASIGFSTSCAPELVPPKEKTQHTDASSPDNSTPQEGPPKTRVVPGQKVTNKDLGSGVTQTRLNTSDAEAWLYFSFATGKQAKPQDPKTSKEWDLAFQRFKGKTNGGISGSGGVEVAILDNQTFESVTTAPEKGYISDKEDGSDEDKDPDFAFLVQKAWYVYNPTDHTLKPRKRIYVLKSTDGTYYKIQFTKYYDDNGNSGFPTFKWAKVTPPKNPPTPKGKIQNKDLGNGVTESEVNASDAKVAVYFSFDKAGEVTPKTPADSKEWDMSFARSVILSNGGVSGKGGVEAAIIDDKGFDDIKEAPANGYIKDVKDGPDRGEDADSVFLVQKTWYVYNPHNHQLTTRKRVYVVKATNGKYYKVQFLSFTNGEKKTGYPTFKWAEITPPK